MGRLLCCALILALGSAVSLGCGDTEDEQRALLRTHAPEVKSLLRGDRQRHEQGIRRAAELLAGGFAIEASEERETQLRQAMRYITNPQHPPDRIVQQLAASPLTFFVAVASNGAVIARSVADPDDDNFRGQDFGERFEVVASGLSARRGEVRTGLGEFPAETGPPSYSWMFVAPVFHEEGERLGAVAIGIPLRNLAKRLQDQLALDHGTATPGSDLKLWVYAYKGPHLAHLSTPLFLDGVVPDGEARRAGLAESPGGFTGEVNVRGRLYGMLVLPIPTLAEDAGLMVFRSDPQ